jgi:DNA repair exonuclease SbcCD ATPase subunit
MSLFQELSDVEAKRLKYLAQADAKREEIAKLIGDVEKLEKAENDHRREVKKLKQDRENEQLREESQDQAESVRSDIQSLEESYKKIAQDHVWYAGNDDVDPIMPFQWRGALFGAGAKRWVLGDGMGLGEDTAKHWLA